jgi:hypothetical protein
MICLAVHIIDTLQLGIFVEAIFCCPKGCRVVCEAQVTVAKGN